MKKSPTASFSLSLKLNTTQRDDRILGKRFFYAFLMKNRLIKRARKALSSMRQDKEYRSLIKEYISVKDKDDPISKSRYAELMAELSRVRQKYGLSEYQFHSWIKTQQHRYRKHIDSNTAQKIATSVWQSVEDVLFRKGKTIHVKKLDQPLSLEGKTNTSGIRFKDGRLYWFGLVIQPQIRKGDTYAREALKHRVKFCRIKREAMGISYHYYLELILEGRPPKKREYIDGRVGLDQGTSSEAVFSEHGCVLTELAPERPEIEKQVSKLQRKPDRSRRANNPQNYDPDGAIKKGRKTWHKSGTYKQARMRLKTLRRRNAATVKQSEEIFANEILTAQGSDIMTEKMSYKALQARSKETKTDSKGRHVSKKRFGKSLAKHAPAKFLCILERKLDYINKTVNYVDTWKFKASQYDHVLGDYLRVPLSRRSKFVGNARVQRDLYSAFVLWAALDDVTIDRDVCFEYFPLFLDLQGACIDKLLSNEHSLSSFGSKDLMM